MGPIKLNFDYRDLFRAPRLALSGKKIWIFIVGNLAGFIAYWIFSYLSLVLAGKQFSDAVAQYGLYPCLFGNEAEWYSWLLYLLGIFIWTVMILLSCTAVSRVTIKQLKGDDFFSSSDAWSYVYKHWHAIVLSPIAILLIALIFILFAGGFAFLGSIPFLGELLFVIPFILYFFGSLFTIYTFFVFLVSLIYTPSIVGVYEEDTMGTVFNSYSITISHCWRIILYHLLLFSLLILGIEIFTWFSVNAIGFINYLFGCEWFMAGKLTNISALASSLVCPQWICEIVSSIRDTITSWFGLCYCIPSLFVNSCEVQSNNISTMETISGVILSVSYFLIGLSIISYGLSIISVGETLMFLTFKKKSDDDNLLLRKDEDDIDKDNENLENDSSLSNLMDIDKVTISEEEE